MVSRDDILAILRAHRDLGPHYDEQLADQLWILTQQAAPPGETIRSPFGMSFDFGKISRPRRFSFGWRPVTFLLLGTPLTAVAGYFGAALGVIAALFVVALMACLETLWSGSTRPTR